MYPPEGMFMTNPILNDHMKKVVEFDYWSIKQGGEPVKDWVLNCNYFDMTVPVELSKYHTGVSTVLQSLVTIRRIFEIGWKGYCDEINFVNDNNKE